MMDLQNNDIYNISSEICPGITDDYLQWDILGVGQNASQLCPKRKGFDPTKWVMRICVYADPYDADPPGLTDIPPPPTTQRHLVEGFTNYAQCCRDTLLPLLKLMKIQGLTEIVNSTRIMELIGLSISLISLVISLVIFHRYRILRNNRTKIHKNLFTAILLQVVFRLLQYADQWAPIVDPYTTEYLCIAEVILLEFGKIAMVIWMFIEGLYLHNAITLTIFQQSKIRCYFYFGWGASIIFTTIWVISMKFVNTDVCWFLYQFELNYWILEGPSSAILIINILFLLNIIRILIAKLRQTQTGELEQLRKAVKAATFLVPLMGITNALFMVSFSVFDQLYTFAIWAFITYFLASFQGCIISVLYCFLNGEVKAAIRNSISVYYFQLYLKSDRINNRRSSLGDTGLTTLEGRT